MSYNNKANKRHNIIAAIQWSGDENDEIEIWKVCKCSLRQLVYKDKRPADSGVVLMVWQL